MLMKWIKIFYGIILFTQLHFTGGSEVSEGTVSPVEELEVVQKLAHQVTYGKPVSSAFQLPHQVSLRLSGKKWISYEGFFFCGGSIIHEAWIITSGHCLYMPKNKHIIEAEDIIVVAGETDSSISISKAKYKRTVCLSIIHPKWQQPSPDAGSDIALLQVKHPWIFNFWVKSIPIMRFPIPLDSTCFTSGWGKPSEKESVSTSLQYLDILLLSNSVCQQKIPKQDYTYKEDIICASYLSQTSKTPCFVDSGSPLVCHCFLAGIISRYHESDKISSDTCDNTLQTFTSIHYHRHWIFRSLRNAERCYVPRGGVYEGESNKTAGKTSNISLKIFYLTLLCLLYTYKF